MYLSRYNVFCQCYGHKYLTKCNEVHFSLYLPLSWLSQMFWPISLILCMSFVNWKNLIEISIGLISRREHSCKQVVVAINNSFYGSMGFLFFNSLQKCIFNFVGNSHIVLVGIRCFSKIYCALHWVSCRYCLQNFFLRPPNLLVINNPAKAILCHVQYGGRVKNYIS